MKLSIAVDARALEAPMSGVGRYLREILSAAGRVDPEADWSLRRPPRWLGRGALSRFAPLPLDRLGPRPDVYFAPANLPPLFARSPTVLVVHDLTFRTRRNEHTRAFAHGMSLVFGRGIQAVASIQTPSEATRRDLLRLYPEVGDRVRVVPYGVSERFSPLPEPGERERLRGRYPIPETYALAVGVQEPRKNLRTLAAVFEDRGAPLPPLVVAGPPGWGGAAVHASPRVIPIGTIAEEDLPALYREALFLAYPSLEEGFGFPPLEAMASGCPVLASDRGAIPEVVADAGFLVEPQREPIAEAAERLAADRGLRERLRALGLRRAAEFTWERCARETLRTLREAAGLRSPPEASPRGPRARSAPRTSADSRSPSASSAPVP